MVDRHYPKIYQIEAESRNEISDYLHLSPQSMKNIIIKTKRQIMNQTVLESGTLIFLAILVETDSVN